MSVRSPQVEPAQLAADLGPALATPAGPAREALLAEVVQPYLQLATERVDEHTGLRLLDIWRYCRHTWSLPYHSQPGRRMFYLVRDRARPRHPVMGIAALGSAVVQISLRDRAIGWDLKTLRRQPLAEAAARMPALHSELTRAIAEIYPADFWRRGLVTVADLQQPSAASPGGATKNSCRPAAYQPPPRRPRPGNPASQPKPGRRCFGASGREYWGNYWEH
ncbi:MAG: Druantia anti-phage system protein DruA [Hymenobacter sp.]